VGQVSEGDDTVQDIIVITEGEPVRTGIIVNVIIVGLGPGVKAPAIGGHDSSKDELSGCFRPIPIITWRGNNRL
jgi:hypothetical protein